MKVAQEMAFPFNLKQIIGVHIDQLQHLMERISNDGTGRELTPEEVDLVRPIVAQYFEEIFQELKLQYIVGNKRLVNNALVDLKKVIDLV